MKKSPYELDFEQYIIHSEADTSKKQKANAWNTAIGLQQVDGLKTSQYLYETARRNIEGDITFEDAKAIIDSYYESRTDRNQVEDEDERTEEADKVSSRIAQILCEPSFTFSPVYFTGIHRRLFEGIFKFAGQLRDYDISKKEWVLNGDTVMYGAAFELRAALEYDFEQERNFSYKNLSMEQIVRHIAFFVSRLWQIHVFGEGNTRTTAVFTIKYLRSLGFDAGNDLFARNSWYFRNALVRANYKDVQKGIDENPEYLEKFFRNLLLHENNELKNRYCHVDYKTVLAKIAADNANDTLNLNDDTLNLNDDTLNLSNDTLNASNDTLNADDDTLNTNDDTLNANSDTLNADNDTLIAGNDTLNASNDTLNTNDDTLNTDDDTLNVDDDTLNVDNDTLNVDNDTLDVDNDTLNDTLKLTPKEIAVLNAIKGNAEINADSIIEKTGFSRSTIMRIIKALKGKKVLERVGSRKTGSWKVIK